MNNKYCPHCGFKNTWTTEKPKVCAKCVKDMDKVFTLAAASAITAPLPSTPQTITPPTRRIIDARGNDITARFQPKTPTHQPVIQNDGEESDYVDLNEVSAQAAELAASISSQDFIIQMEEPEKTTSLGSILRPILEQQAAASQAAPKKRKSRK